jgi:superoxide dismutase, Cu-Zn family
MAVAVYKQSNIVGEAIALPYKNGSRLTAVFTKLPAGKHGFHIHIAGDLRGEGCAGACDHYHVGKPSDHGGRPGTRKTVRHSGDLGNIQIKSGSKKARYTYILPDSKPCDLWGRTLIIHKDEDDLGKGTHADSKTTGHSGARIGCAIFGRITQCKGTRKSR